MITAQNNIIGTPENFIKDRKQKREQIRNSKDQIQKNKLRKQIIQSELDQKKIEMEKKQRDLKQIKEDIKENYYKLVNDTDLFYKKCRITESSREFSKRMGKSPCYFKSAESYKRFPTIQILNDLIYDLDFILINLNKYIDDDFNKKQVKEKIKILLSKFKKLKNEVLEAKFNE